MDKLVTTVNGEKIERSLCRYIAGDFYKIGDPEIKDSGECYLVNGRYYRVNTGYIVYDESQKKYVIASEGVVEGIVGMNQDGSFEYGSFTYNPIYHPRVIVGGAIKVAASHDIFKANRLYRFHVPSNAYVHINKEEARSFSSYAYVDHDEKYGLPYNCDGLIDSFSSQFEKSEIIISKEAEEAAKTLKGLTFGWEFETVQGRVPKELCKPLGLITLRDGSISGLEYATIPYGEAKGVEATSLVCDALDKHTSYDDNCSLHLHIGGMPRTKKYLLALFKTLCIIQDDVFDLFPIYKKYNYGVKRKNYTKPLPAVELLSKLDRVIDDKNLDTNFDFLFQFLSMGIPIGNYHSSKSLDAVTHHPSDPRGSSKWNIRTRYHWVNLIPIVFGNKKTVEFRIHTPTTDKNKVLSYLLICGGIINYVKDNQNSILAGEPSVSLEDMLYSQYAATSHSVASTLTQYIKNRKQETYMQTSAGNLKGDEKAIKSFDILKAYSKPKGKDPFTWSAAYANMPTSRAIEELYSVAGQNPIRSRRRG
jgi:hypothetical protein